ncbi:aldehyde dehydrogenase [Paraburkholderia sediminicola]|uniref:aldehyde dehydrogenase n=1 Tax=Paraburkholderia sediminicola TaxID=458836 RepID=UPI000E76C6B6
MNEKAAATLSERDFLFALKSPDRLYIGGEWVSPISGEVRTLVSPGSGRNFIAVAHGGVEDVDRAVAAARAAFDHGPWPRMTPAERASYLTRLGAEIVARSNLMAGLQAAEMGALYGMTAQIVPFFAGTFDFYAAMAGSFPFIERHQPSVGGVGYLVQEPVGVCAAIVPWNGPLMLACWKLAPALLAGCTVVLKASPEAPATLVALAEAVEAAGLPAGVVNVITADREISERLVRHPGVDKVSFTGSTGAGKKIGAICAERVARCTLELGGKSPAILLDDYDIDAFADHVASAATLLSGQVCAALTRIIVPRAKQGRVLDAIAARFEAVKVGNPFDPSTGMGPLASAAQCGRVERYIETGRKEGSRLVCGGTAPAGLDPRFYMAPTLFGDVDNRATIAREEIFGPVLSVIPVDSEDHAIAVANDSDFGLNATVFTHDSDHAFKVARRLRSGTVAHNGFKTDFTIAFGGFKQSGVGREGGVPGLRAYLEPKTVLLADAVSHFTQAPA